MGAYARACTLRFQAASFLMRVLPRGYVQARALCPEDESTCDGIGSSARQWIDLVHLCLSWPECLRQLLRCPSPARRTACVAVLATSRERELKELIVCTVVPTAPALPA